MNDIERATAAYILGHIHAALRGGALPLSSLMVESIVVVSTTQLRVRFREDIAVVRTATITVEAAQ